VEWMGKGRRKEVVMARDSLQPLEMDWMGRSKCCFVYFGGTSGVFGGL
jgi:hypothetical protein